MNPLFLLVHCLCKDAETTGRLSAGSATTSTLQNSPSCDWSLDLVNKKKRKRSFALFRRVIVLSHTNVFDQFMAEKLPSDDLYWLVEEQLKFSFKVWLFLLPTFNFRKPNRFLLEKKMFNFCLLFQIEKFTYFCPRNVHHGVQTRFLLVEPRACYFYFRNLNSYFLFLCSVFTFLETARNRTIPKRIQQSVHTGGTVQHPTA